MINGIGGSSDFLRDAYLSIMHTPSVRPAKTDPTGINCVVPMVSHVDHTEHDLDVLITEQGLADICAASAPPNGPSVSSTAAPTLITGRPCRTASTGPAAIAWPKAEARSLTCSTECSACSSIWRSMAL